MRRPWMIGIALSAALVASFACWRMAGRRCPRHSAGREKPGEVQRSPGQNALDHARRGYSDEEAERLREILKETEFPIDPDALWSQIPIDMNRLDCPLGGCFGQAWVTSTRLSPSYRLVFSGDTANPGVSVTIVPHARRKAANAQVPGPH